MYKGFSGTSAGFASDPGDSTNGGNADAGSFCVVGVDEVSQNAFRFLLEQCHPAAGHQMYVLCA